MLDNFFSRSLHLGMTTLLLASGSLMIATHQSAQSTPVAVSSTPHHSTDNLLASSDDDNDDKDEKDNDQDNDKNENEHKTRFS